MRAFKKEIQDTKDNIKQATRILDAMAPLTDKERYYLIDVFIKSNMAIEKLEREVQKYENKITAENRKFV